MFTQTDIRSLSGSLNRLPKRRVSALFRHAPNSARTLVLRRVVFTSRFQRDEMTAIEASPSQNANPVSRSPL
jgi:hypothetical protein